MEKELRIRGFEKEMKTDSVDLRQNISKVERKQCRFTYFCCLSGRNGFEVEIILVILKLIDIDFC